MTYEWINEKMNELKSQPLTKSVRPLIIFTTLLGKAFAQHAQRPAGVFWNSLQNGLTVVCWRFAASRVKRVRAPGEPLPVQWIADEPLIVCTGSGSSLTLPPLYFDLYFMRTAKAHQVQQESTSDKSHLLLVSSSVRQTDAISLLTRLYDPHMTIAG